jgi:predicted flap endonuclease-1-like 5' DNA nuclease
MDGQKKCKACAPPETAKEDANRGPVKTQREKNREYAAKSRERKRTEAAASIAKAKEQRTFLRKKHNQLKVIRGLTRDIANELNAEGPYMRKECAKLCNDIIAICDGAEEDGMIE